MDKIWNQWWPSLFGIKLRGCDEINSENMLQVVKKENTDEQSDVLLHWLVSINLTNI